MKVRVMMMAGALALAALTTSCAHEFKSLIGADGPKVTEKRNLRDFEIVEIKGSTTVHYAQGDTFSVVVKGTEAKMDEIITEVHDNVLTIRNKWRKNSVVNITPLREEVFEVYVTSPDLIGVWLNGSGDFISKQRVDTDNINITLRGSGDIDFADLICDRCQVELMGSGDIDVERLEAQEVSAVLIGSGDIDLKEWNVASTTLGLKGSGDISVSFMEGCRRATCELRGSGDISLKGRLERFSQQKSGSGDVHTGKLIVEK